MPRRTILAAAAVLVALVGCATRPPAMQELAGVQLPAQWAQAAPAGSGSVAAWWHAFGDPLLVDLVQAALRGNTTLAAARANLRQARALRTQAVAGLGPALTAGGSAQRSHPAGGAGRSSFDAGFDAAWEVDLFGANAHEAAAQQALAEASAAQLAATQVSVAAEVGLAYLDLRTAQVRAGVARENLRSQEETLQISRWRQQAGLANALEVEQALAAVEQTRAQVPALQAAAAQAAHALAVLTGRPPADLLQALSPPAALPRPGAALEVAVPAEVLRRRPDVQAAEHQWRAAAERVAQARALRLPGVNLSASLAWTGATLGSLGGVSAARSLLASIAQPLFDGGRLRAQQDAQEAAFDAAGEAYRASVLTALQDVEDALVALAADRERLDALQRALEAARNASLLATQRHASGLVDFQTVLETQRTLLSVQDSVASLQAALAADHVRLYKALGGGWPAPDPEKAT